MPSQLVRRLNRFLDQQPAQNVVNPVEAPDNHRVDHPPQFAPGTPGAGGTPQNENNPPAQNTTAHWPRGWGTPLGPVQSVVIHETSGWPSYASASNFQDIFRCLHLTFAWKPATQNVPGHWVNNRGIGPQYFVDANGTAFSLVGPQDLAGPPRQTWHAEAMNPLSLGIENGDTGDTRHLDPGNGAGPRWWQLSTAAEDLTGMKLYLLLHPADAEDVSLIWHAQFPQTSVNGHWVPRPGAGPPYAGSGDIDDGQNPVTDRKLTNFPQWNNMIFTERDYRSLALLGRLLAEQNGIPRNFPLLPYADVGRDQPSAAIFRQLILADQQCDAIAQKLGTTTAVIQASGAAFTQWYTGPADRWTDAHGVQHTGRNWARFFGVDPTHTGVADTPCFKGFLSHSMNGHHPCPGPLFDWHRLAREVGDWWWYPFDTDPLTVTTTRRPYQQARHNTQLLDYYYDSTGTPQDYDRLRQPLSVYDQFQLPAAAPVYALANGVVVAARFALTSEAVSTGFLLVRHEVFHQAGASQRIDYDQAPTYVWSLTSFLDNGGFSVPAQPPALPGTTPAANPDWLNRFILRLRECELAQQFRTANAGNAALNRGWAHNPSSPGPRLATGQEIERDAAAYRTLAGHLLGGQAVLFPLEGQTAPTPVRVILGDFLGFPGLMAPDQPGIQVEIFSRDQLDIPGAVHRACSVSTEAWWADATAAVRHEAEAGMDLPADGMVWEHPLKDFLPWVNTTTWQSEWAKYGTAAPASTRPVTRRVT